MGCRRLLTVAGCSLLVLLYPLAGTAGVWNPFEGGAATPTLTSTVTSLLRSVLTSIEETIGRVVSRFRLPDPTSVGIRAQSFYRPAVVPLSATIPSSTGVRAVTTPTPAPSDRPGTTGAFWASDCSCRRGQTCTDNPEVLCGEAGCPQKLTIGDKSMTVAHCRAHQHTPTPEGGEPRTDFHF